MKNGLITLLIGVIVLLIVLLTVLSTISLIFGDAFVLDMFDKLDMAIQNF